ncbi:MAG: HipA domain-containing protein [Flavobacteriales bacterium]
MDFHAQCSRKMFGSDVPPKIDYSFDQMEELAKSVIERSVVVPGVQPKLSVQLERKRRNQKEPRLTIVGTLGGNYILKPPSIRFPELPANEHLTMRLAENYGIQVVPSSLIRLASGELAYVTKRVDRTPKGDKIHMLDMFQITEAFDKYKGSMEKVGKAIDSYSVNTLLDKSLFFDLALFCYLTGNNDMHLKNFSMIKGPFGWVLSPAYDLLNVSIVLPNDTEELALTLNGKKRKLKLSHFFHLGETLGLNQRQIENSIERMLNEKVNAIKLIKQSFLSKEMKISYENLVNSRYMIFQSTHS